MHIIEKEKNIISEIRAAGKSAGNSIAVFCFAVILSCLVSMKSYAEESADSAIFAGFPEPPLEELDIILGSRDFGSEREVWSIRRKEKETSKSLSEFNFEPASWMDKMKWFFAVTLRIILITAISAVGILSFLYLYKRNRSKKAVLQQQKSYGITPDVPESPESFLARSRTLYAQGQIRAAWAACFAGSIAALVRYKGLHIPPGATEYDCLALVRRAAPENAGGFAGLLKHWIPFAYSGKAPEDGAFQASLQFCEYLAGQKNNG